MGYSLLQDMGFDVLREFWPEISRKFRLPFRGEAKPGIDHSKLRRKLLTGLDGSSGRGHSAAMVDGIPSFFDAPTSIVALTPPA